MKKGGYGLKIFLFVIGLIMMGASLYSKLNENYSLTIYVLSGLGLLSFILSAAIKPSDVQEKKLSVKEISMIGVQGAIASLLYIFVKFNLPFFPSFLDIQVSEIPALITSFAYGPAAGCFVIVVRFIIKLPFTGTAGVGEVADLILGLILVFVSGYIYKKKRTLNGALIGTGLGMSLAIFLGMFVNWLILIPFYIELYFHGSVAPLLGMCSMIPGINESNYMLYYIFFGALPFNIFRYVIVFMLTFILYKRVHFLIKKITK